MKQCPPHFSKQKKSLAWSMIIIFIEKKGLIYFSRSFFSLSRSVLPNLLTLFLSFIVCDPPQTKLTIIFWFKHHGRRKTFIKMRWFYVTDCKNHFCQPYFNTFTILLLRNCGLRQQKRINVLQPYLPMTPITIRSPRKSNQQTIHLLSVQGHSSELGQNSFTDWCVHLWEKLSYYFSKNN